jgi:hypothetical protein
MPPYKFMLRRPSRPLPYMILRIDVITRWTAVFPSLSFRQRDARLHVTFAKEHKQLWMEGTHSFEELQVLMSDIDPGGLTTVKVQIGQVSVENKSRGKGLRTKDEQEAVD